MEGAASCAPASRSPSQLVLQDGCAMAEGLTPANLVEKGEKTGESTRACLVDGLSQNGQGTIMTYDLLSYDLMVI